MSTSFITINSVRLQAVDGNNVLINVCVCVCVCILLYSLFPDCCCCPCLLLLFVEQCQRFDVLTICHAKLGSSRRRGVKINAQQLITPATFVRPPSPTHHQPPSQSPSRSLTDLLITSLHQLSSLCCSSCYCWCFCFSCSFGLH